MSTIFALATATGRAGVAIVRVSGDSAVAGVGRLVRNMPPAQKPSVRVIRGQDGTEIDEALVLVFAAGASFTGEDVVELQLHGSSAVVAAVLRELSAVPELRLANPGEFTRRALENGRLDLTQVEGLADLIDAETEAQRRQALRVMRGTLSDKASTWRESLLRAVALLEVTIDFADEDVPVDVLPEVFALISDVRHHMQMELDGSNAAERIRDGFEVAIVGRPNVGKSTLLNRLAGREAAITSAFAGTTRDVIEVRMDVNGLPITLLDTAGIRNSQDVVEALGVARAVERASSADLRVFLLDVGDRTGDFEVNCEPGDIIARAKSDTKSGSEFGISGLTGHGVDTLIEKLGTELGARASGATTAIRERHRVALSDGVEALDRAMIRVNEGMERSELAAEEIRQALHVTNTIVGRVDVENILDVIFSSFCLGK